MPTISERKDYNGVLARIERLGLAPLLAELKEVLTAFELRVKEEKDANGGAAVRKLIDARFESAGFVNVRFVRWTGGIVTLHTAEKSRL